MVSQAVFHAKSQLFSTELFPSRIYYCPDCNAKHIGAKDIVQHCRERHGSLPFQCRGCSKRFETYNSLIKHKKRLHAEEKPLKKACDRCDKVYLDPKALKQHIKQESISSFYPRYRRFS